MRGAVDVPPDRLSEDPRTSAAIESARPASAGLLSISGNGPRALEAIRT